MSNLYPAIRGERGNSFCGPAAIVSAFGVSVDSATAAIREVSGKPNVFGVTGMVMTLAINRLTPTRVPRMHPTPKQPLERLSTVLPPGVYIVLVTGHYVALDTVTQTVCDNATVYPMLLARYRWRRKHVVSYWPITRKDTAR